MSTRKIIALSVAAVLFAPAVAFAGTAITSLSELAETAAADDQAVVVDVSDTSMAASGTTKRVSVSNLVGGVADAAYLRLDGTNDPVTGAVQFNDDIRGDETSCTPTSLIIDGAPGTYGGNNYDIDIDEYGCTSGAVVALTEDFSTFLTICGEGPAVDIYSMYSGTESVRACLLDMTAAVGPGVYITTLTPSSDTCENIVATIDGFVGPGTTISVDDANFLKWNSATCTYDDRDRLDTYTIVSGWSDPVDVTTDIELMYEWQITDDGDVVVDNIYMPSGGIGVGIEPQITAGANQAGILVYKTYTDFSESEYSAENYLRSGLRFQVYANPAEAYDGSGVYQIAYGMQGLTMTGTANRMKESYGGLFQAYASGDGQVVDKVTSIRAQLGTTHANATITEATCFEADVPFTTGTIDKLYGLHVQDVGSADDEAIGVLIDPITSGPTVAYGIKTGSAVLLADDVALFFGGDEDASIVYDETTDDELKVLFGAAERINMDSTGIAFNGATPVARPDYTTSNCNTDRAFDANATTTEELADVLCTLIADLEAYGLVQ